MQKISTKIVFFGSGPVAAKSLKLLLGDLRLEAIITKPTPNPKDTNPVLDIAKAEKIPYFTTTNRSELDIIILKNSFKSQVAIIIDFGIIISQKVIDHFPKGIINSHFSLLPKWRGADPISFAILNGDRLTGVSLMLINEKMDEGRLLCQEPLAIDHKSSVELTSELIKLSHKMIKNTLAGYLSNSLKSYPQSNKIKPSYSRKLTKEDGQIDWSKSAKDIERQIRAFIIWPKSYTNIFGIPIIITKATASQTKDKTGKIIYDKKSLQVACAKGSLNILKLKPAGKNEMEIASFIAGYKNQFKKT
ncbi:MAG TPA: methionyl-tRNA formyltransferase [Candidatus Saccharimonadia bacterium]|nr:methionyl-tRNA formyltransferase [Candidatus Saccharimonadia bacterium]